VEVGQQHRARQHGAQLEAVGLVSSRGELCPQA